MTQYARPSSDITTGWTTTPLWSKIDEDPASDTDYITGTGASKTAECKLSAVSDPLSSSSHTWRTRLRATGSSSGEKVTLSLYQGSTLIATLINGSTIARGSFADWSGTLTAAQADAITNYSDLRFRWVTGSGNGASETIDCSWAVLEVPDATATYNEDVSLASSRLVSDSSSLSMDMDMSLGKSHSLSDANSGAYNALMDSIQKALGQYITDQSSIAGIVALAIFKSVTESTSTVQTFNEALSLTKSLSQLVGNAGLIRAISSLPMALGISETVSASFSVSVLINLARFISESVQANVLASEGMAKAISISEQPSVMASAILSWAKSNGMALDSEKLLISYVSLGRLEGQSASVKMSGQANLPLNLSLSYGLSGLLSLLSSLDLSRVSQMVMVGAPSGQTIEASLIIGRIQSLFTDGTLGIAITSGSVIIIDVELVKVLVSDFSPYQVRISDESL